LSSSLEPAPIAIALAALALSLGPPAGEASDVGSGVRGIVTISGCPGPQRPGERCTQRFAGARIRVSRAADRRLVRTFRSHARGRFQVSVPPGRYRLDPQPSGIARAGSMTVRVRPHRFRYVHIDYDNGLR
jgi:hypothetical protein